MDQVPIGPKDKRCPLWRKAMSKVCHTCPWWGLVRGKHPQTGEQVDQWNCAIAFMPMLTIQTAMETRQGAASVDALRGEVSASRPAQQAPAPLQRVPDGRASMTGAVLLPPREIS